MEAQKQLFMATILLLAASFSPLFAQKQLAKSSQRITIQQGTMVIDKDFIAIEGEATNTPLKGWALRTPKDAGYDKIKGAVAPVNDSYIEYMEGNISGAGIEAGTNELTYTFTPLTSGDYTLTGRMAQRLTVGDSTARWDLCNDIFLKLSGDFSSANDAPLEILKGWNKYYGRGKDTWGAFVKADVHHKYYTVAYRLQAGKQYTLHISGRSKHCCIDYLLLSKDPLVFNEETDLAEVNDAKYRPSK